MKCEVGTLPKHRSLKIETIDGNWVIGTFKGYTFNAKVFSVGSVFGINNGRISKLWMADANGNWVFNYDRGMDLDNPIGHQFAELFK